ncbi:MAG: ATP-binding protein [Anaerolineae bacterium]|nr:ATP-binding protein [Anaerolineae bacterium]NUQ03758.1 hypothetical protein [Anaerolineae bacterium]
MATKSQLTSQHLADGFPHSVLIFDSADRLVMVNQAAKALLGADLKLIQAEGWSAAQVAFNARLVDHGRTIDDIRRAVIAGDDAVRFSIYRSGERIPCWVSSMHEGGEKYTLLTLDKPDWSAMNDVFDKYLSEVRDVMVATQGHTDLIVQLISRAKPGTSAEQISGRVTGFAKLIDIHMFRLQSLTNMVERLECLRTGLLREQVSGERRKIVLADFMEDFLESLDEIQLVDPESDQGDYRRRIQSIIPPKLAIYASTGHLTTVLQDLLRNAIMYSMRGLPIKVIAYANRDDSAQIDVVDEGYGIRLEERERVFAPFMRARQPQVMGEFGYGLSLYLCKHEIEAMNGRIWFESEEGVGTTFSIKLPLWHETPRESSAM